MGRLTNCSWIRPGTPLSSEFFSVINDELWLFLIPAVLTAILLALFLEEVGFFLRHVQSSRRQQLYLWILGLYPVIALASLIALYIPRSSSVCIFISSLYHSITLLKFMDITRSSLNWMLAAVLQLSVVRSILFFVTLVLWTDEQYNFADVDSINPNLIVNGIIGVSTFLSFYGHLLFYKATKGPLRGHNLGAKFVCIIVVLVLCGLQGGILETLVSLKVVPGTPPFSPGLMVLTLVFMLSSVIYHYAVIVEMFCIGLYARHTFRRVEPGLLDACEKEEEPYTGVVEATDKAVQTDAASVLGLRRPWSRGEGGSGGGGVNNLSYQSDSEENLCKIEHVPLHCFPFPLPPSLQCSGKPDKEANLRRPPRADDLNLTSIRCKSLQASKYNFNDYEVDYLCDLKTDKNNKELYLVKWKGFPHVDNSWEPKSNLKCTKLMKEFHQDLAQAMRRQHGRSRMVPKQLDKEMSSALVQRAKQRKSLAHWEAHLNETRSHPGRILVLNDVDQEGPPCDFTYINNYSVGQGIVLNEMALGCECKDCALEPLNGCCPGASQHRMAYNQRGQVKVRAGQPIYECNLQCLCSTECPNRVVQRGIQYDLCIFRTANGRGWGVRTTQHIKKNMFVMEYVGEIITTEEAEKRGHLYDRQGSTYLFDLDYVEDVYTVDAAYKGNISHFVNHSCRPNLQVYNVFIDNIDERLPRIALFSTRSILIGEELTFDYKMQIDPVDTESTRMDSSFSLAPLSTNPSSPKKPIRVECRCGSDSCRKYLF
ncbi:hypothetical protein NHX12_012381 [Muraenolepis orangiensis]|uniref:Uncharacterized protein n=1 Tax=Muraenolepis orangiensis TaxID=630683 RepID=A0A9Q0DE84_9TELE|nr:hypothetical protein NHX12_012381 [Muraenolepis orangiensis]